MTVVVVGGGIVGASAAYHLACVGADVVLVDRADNGQATAAGAGIICPGLGPPREQQGKQRQHDAWYAIAYPAAGYYTELVESLAAAGEPDVSYATPGAIFAAEPGGDLDALHALALKRRDAGVPRLGDVSYLPPGQPRELFPYLDAGLAGIHVSDAGRVDGRVLRDALVSAALARGARPLHGSAELMLDGGRLTGVRVEGEPVAADRVVVAAGTWSASLCAPLGLALPVRPQRGQILHLDLPDRPDGELPIVQTFSRYYMLGFPEGRVVAGATRESGSGYDYRLTAAGMHEVLDRTLRTAPGLGDATIAETRVGFRPASQDGLPLLGSAGPGLVLATGLGHTGLTIGPYAGALAARLALDEPVSIDLAPYDPLRGGEHP